MFICSISNTPTATPVLSLKSHAVFDKRALTTYVNSYSIDPVSKSPMSIEDIIPINPTIPATTTTADQIVNQTSIPTMLQCFQDAWDSLALEIFQLKADLDRSRKELSLALYKQDAAVRVAMKVTREKDELLKALALLGHSNTSTATTTTSTTTTSTDNVNMSELITNIQHAQQSLFDKHKAQNKTNKPLSPLNKQNFTLSIGSLTSISETPSGIVSLLLNESHTSSLVKHTNGQIELLNKPADSLSLEVQSVFDSSIAFPLWLQSTPYVVSITPRKRKGRQSKKSKSEPQPQDIHLVSLPDKKQIKINLETSENELVDVIGHPTLPLFVIVKEKELIMCQLSKDQIDIAYSEPLELSILAGAIHPDGVLFARALASNVIEIFDLANREVKLTIEAPQEDDLIKSIVFAPNGYSIVIEYTNNIAIYDLRKAQFQSTLPKPADSTGVSIDQFSSIILCGGEYSKYDKKTKNWLEFTGLSLESSVTSVWFHSFNDDFLILAGRPTGLDFGLASIS